MSIIEITPVQLKARVGLVEYIANFDDAVILPPGWIDKTVLYWCLNQNLMHTEFLIGEMVRYIAYNKDKSATVTFHMQKLSDFEKSVNVEIHKLRSSYDELKTTHADLQAALQRTTHELSTIRRELYEAHSTIANMTDTIGMQEETIKRHVYDKDAMDSTFLLLNSEAKNEHAAEIREICTRLRREYENLEGELKDTREQLDNCNQELQQALGEIEILRSSNMAVDITINLTWTCPCCIEEFTPSHDSIICVNALCNVRMCMGCIRKLPIRREHIKCPYCRVEYKIESAQQIANLKKQVHVLHTKCAELIKIVNHTNPTGAHAADEPAKAHAADEPAKAHAADEPAKPARRPVADKAIINDINAELFPMPPMPPMPQMPDEALQMPGMFVDPIAPFDARLRHYGLIPLFKRSVWRPSETQNSPVRRGDFDAEDDE